MEESDPKKLEEISCGDVECYYHNILASVKIKQFKGEALYLWQIYVLELRYGELESEHLTIIQDPLATLATGVLSLFCQPELLHGGRG